MYASTQAMCNFLLVQPLWKNLEIYEDDNALVSLDNNSLYPYAMTHPIPIGPGTVLGKEASGTLFSRIVDIEHPREWGIVRATIHPDSFPTDCFPIFSIRRPEGGGLLYCNQHDEPITDYFTSLDLATYAWVGAKFEIHEGVWWTLDSELSTEYIPLITNLFRERCESNDESKKSIIKHILVNIFGITGYKTSPTKDVLIQRGESIDPKELVVGKVVQTWHMPTCSVYKLKAYFEHMYSAASTKSTITNNVLSRARYHMVLCLKKVGIAHWSHLSHQQALRNMLREVHYTDTDSDFVKKKWERDFAALGLISNRMGDFKNDYNGVIPYMFAGAPKNRTTEIVYRDETEGPSLEYKIRLVSRFKGMTLSKELAIPAIQRQAFASVNLDYTVSLGKTVWNRSLDGVTTKLAPFKVFAESLMKDKQGVRMYLDDGAMVIRSVQKGDAQPVTLQYPDLSYERDHEVRADMIRNFTDLYKKTRENLLLSFSENNAPQ